MGHFPVKHHHDMQCSLKASAGVKETGKLQDEVMESGRQCVGKPTDCKVLHGLHKPAAAVIVS